MAERAASSALEDIAAIFEPDQVHAADEAQQRYGISAMGIKRRIAGAVRTRDTGQVQQVVRIANRHGVPLYPISRGHNWGYGAANPVVDDSLVVDLSEMDRVVDFDPDLGTVTVEPRSGSWSGSTGSRPGQGSAVCSEPVERCAPHAESSAGQ